jgi:hypothetical protein
MECEMYCGREVGHSLMDTAFSSSINPFLARLQSDTFTLHPQIIVVLWIRKTEMAHGGKKCLGKLSWETVT